MAREAELEAKRDGWAFRTYQERVEYKDPFQMDLPISPDLSIGATLPSGKAAIPLN